MLNLAKAKPSSSSSFTKQTTIKKNLLWKGKLQFSLPDSPRAWTATQTTAAKTAACQSHLKTCTRSWKEQAKGAQKSAPFPPFAPSGFNVNDTAPRA